MSEGGSGSGGVLRQAKERTFDLVVPQVSPPLLQVLLGLLNIFCFGLGVIIAGLINKDWADVLIGVVQLVVPVIGWVFAWVWGALMILRVVM